MNIISLNRSPFPSCFVARAHYFMALCFIALCLLPGRPSQLIRLFMRNVLPRCVFIILTLLVSFSSQAEYGILTPEEEVERDAVCAKDIKCVMAWAELKQRVADRNAELDMECNAHPANCEKATLALATYALRERVKCDGDPTICRDTFNKTADELELNLINASWCGYNPRPCKLVKRNREQRAMTAENKTLAKKMWCDSYPDICERAIAYRSQLLLDEARRIKRKEEENEMRRLTNVRDRLLAQIAKHEAMLATCDNAKTCEGEINIRIGLAAAKREAQWCENQQVEACDLLKDLRKERKLTAKTWCQMNADLCRDAREKFQDQDQDQDQDKNTSM